MKTVRYTEHIYMYMTLNCADSRLASFPGSRAGEEEREPGTHCSRMCQVPLVTCILLCCTKITVNSAYLLKGHTAPSETHTGGS